MNPLIRLIPPALVRVFAEPYVAGDSLQKAMDVAARELRQHQLRTTLDLLAENVQSTEAIEQNVRTYLAMIDAAAGDDRFPSPELRPALSLKLSSYTTDPLDQGGAAETSREAVFRIGEYAKEKGVKLTVDMEGRHWTEFTLRTLADLHRAGHDHIGAVLQTRLNRTEADLDRLPPGCRVRLVIGIYREPDTVAITNKRQMKQRMLDYAAHLLRRDHYVEFGTHDEPWIRRFVEDVAPAAGADPDRFELQMLYGVPRARLLRQMVGRGVTARLYVPFAESWPMAIRYLRRRLSEYPAMMFLVAKNLLLRR